MSYETPESRRAKVVEVREILLSSRRVVLTTHANADGDAAGSEAAVASWLRANGTEVTIVNPTPFPNRFKWMIDEPRNVVRTKSTLARDRCAESDLAVVLDTCDIGRLGSVWQLIKGLRVVVVDHHLPGTRPVGGVQLTDTDACAAGELVYDLISDADGPWTRNVIDGLYVAISTDTGSYRFDNSTQAAHAITADLIERGVSPGEVSRRLYGAVDLRRYGVMREVLSTLESDRGVTSMVVSQETCRNHGARPSDLQGFVDIPRSVRGTEIAILFRETERCEVKVSFRAAGGVNVAALAAEFGGGGHEKASGALVAGELSAVVEDVRRAAAAAVGAR
ncbi:MAG: bifunctional oligoribonuclease/PAP phosphatase NrnA [Gemmatimonadetes bacterium]|nr:bifunctional oligoribonuclease/PAP phosphatase NrnA [Gemmatimonadota bacterium]